jgi:hypothetical protein
MDAIDSEWRRMRLILGVAIVTEETVARLRSRSMTMLRLAVVPVAARPSVPVSLFGMPGSIDETDRLV